MMGISTKVEMRCDGVLQEMDQAVSGKHEQRRPAKRQFEAFRDHLEQNRGKHEACAQGNEVA